MGWGRPTDYASASNRTACRTIPLCRTDLWRIWTLSSRRRDYSRREPRTESPSRCSSSKEQVNGYVERWRERKKQEDRYRKREILRYKDRETERDRLNVIFIFWKCIWEIRTDNPSLAVKILNDTPRPNVPSWLQIASDNHSRILTTLLPRLFIINSNFCLLYITLSHKHACLYDGWIRRASTPIFG